MRQSSELADFAEGLLELHFTTTDSLSMIPDCKLDPGTAHQERPPLRFESILSLVALIAFLLVSRQVFGQDRLVDHYPRAAESGCLACHGDIEPIREIGSEMLDQIMMRGASAGDPAGCIVCHNGNPTETTDKTLAHGGEDFYPDPGSSWVNNETCGQCHQEQVDIQWQSLMMTESGKIQGTCWSFGALTGYEHTYANYAVENPADPDSRLGTKVYREYMQRLQELEPNVFVDRHEALPEAPGFDDLDQRGQLAIDMSPTQPHTMTKNARTCESCHANDKALGLGIAGTRP